MDMLHALISGFLQCFNLSTFNLMMVGIAIGFVVGILPGLGGPTAMALMLPFVFKMSAVEAFAFLLGMTAVTATTGDITSVLFGVPGEPTTASTIVDGHAMARNGETGRALGAVLMSSLVGAVFAGVALGAAVPIIRPLVLSFGSPEFFMPKGGDLKRLAIDDNQNDAELRSHGDSLRKKSLNLFRPGIGRDVVILRWLLQQHIANATAGKESLVSLFA